MAAAALESILCGCIVLMVIGDGCFLAMARSTATAKDKSVELLQQHLCRDECRKKFAMDDMSCLQQPECSMCWDECSASTSINKSILDTWSLDVISMVRDNSLVSTNIAWTASNAPSDCLVTWEVSGGGLIGNLLTQSSNVELSLWPETKYRVQVTCKNKQTEEISRSLPLTLDTSKALVMVRVPTAASTSTLSGDDDTSSQTQDQSIILRDSSSSSSGSSGSSSSGSSSRSSSSFSGNDNNSSNNNDDDDDIDAADNNDDGTNKIYEDVRFDQSSFETTLASSSFLVWVAYENNKEIVLGSCAALTVFLTVLLAFIVSRRKTRTTMDKAPLVDNEVSVNVDVERLTIHV